MQYSRTSTVHHSVGLFSKTFTRLYQHDCTVVPKRYQVLTSLSIKVHQLYIIQSDFLQKFTRLYQQLYQKDTRF